MTDSAKHVLTLRFLDRKKTN